MEMIEMNEEKIRIMQMVKDGTLSPEEGLDLIESLGRHHKGESNHCPHGKAKWLYIQVNEEDGKNVNIKVPLSLVKFAGKFIPNEAKKELKEQGIELDLDGILSSLQDEGEMNLVEINDEDGKTVRIFTGIK